MPRQEQIRKQVRMNESHPEDEETERQAEVKATASQNIGESRHIIQVARRRIAEAKRLIASTRRRATKGEATQGKATQEKPLPPA